MASVQHWGIVSLYLELVILAECEVFTLQLIIWLLTQRKPINKIMQVVRYINY